jgi:hypothetical protein
MKRISVPPLRQPDFFLADRGQNEILLEEIKRHHEKSGSNCECPANHDPTIRGLITRETGETGRILAHITSMALECSRFSHGVEPVVAIGRP